MSARRAADVRTNPQYAVLASTVSVYLKPLLLLPQPAARRLRSGHSRGVPKFLSLAVQARIDVR